MFSRVISLLLLSTSLAFAQQGEGQFNGGMTRGNLLRVPDYKTTGTAAWFLDPAGSDSNNCTSSTTPCLTLLGVQAKMPKVVRNPVTITFANGNYAGGWFSEFQFAPTSASVGAYIMFQSNGLTTFSPATGSATGTATSGTACNNAVPYTQASLTDTGATWTIDNLRGQIIETTGGTGSGQFLPIISNTATVITIAGCWGVTPNATTTYAIRDWGVVITSGTNQPPDPITAAGNATGLGLLNGHDSERGSLSAFYYVDSIRISTAGTGGALRVANADVYTRRSRFDSSTQFAPGVSLVGAGRTTLISCVATNSANGNALGTAGPAGSTPIMSAPPSVAATNTYFQSASSNTNAGVFLGTGAVSFNGVAIRMTNSGATSAVKILGNVSGANFQDTHVFCTSGGTTVGLHALNAAQTNAFASNNVSMLWDSSSINECATSIMFDGRMQSLQTDDATFQATAGTAALSVSNGAIINLDVNSGISGSFTNQINIQTGGITANFADVPASRALAVPDTGATVISVP